MKQCDLLSEWQQVPGILFYPALCLFLFQFYFNNIRWNISLPGSYRTFFLDIAGVLCICGLLFVLMMHEHYVWTFLFCILICVLYFKYEPGWQDLFEAVFIPAALVIMAAGKNYRTILKCYLGVVAGCYFLALSGQVFRFTMDAVTYDSHKIERVGIGHSLGFTHPNSLAINAFLICLLVWILWIYRYKVLTFVLFWGAAVPLWFISKSRTCVLFLIAFPVLALFTGESSRSSSRPVRKTAYTFWVLMPFLCLAVSLILCQDLGTLVDMFLNTSVWNLAMRFVAGGIALKTYGIHLLGQEIDLSGNVMMRIHGANMYLVWVDNGYICSLIKYGALFTAIKLGIISCVHVKCLRAVNKRLLLLSAVMLLLAVIEGRGLTAEYNPVILALFAQMESIRGRSEQSAGRCCD